MPLLTKPRAPLAGALAWICAAQFFLAEAIARGAATNYSMSLHDISYLGFAGCEPYSVPATGAVLTICSPLHGLMNGSFVLAGLLTIAGAILTRRAWPATLTARLGLVLVGASGVGPVLLGLAPVDLYPAPHVAGVLIHFALMPPGILLLGLSLRRGRPRAAAFSILCASATALGLMLYQTGMFGMLGRGGAERLAAYPLTVWTVAMGLMLLIDQRRDRAMERTGIRN